MRRYVGAAVLEDDPFLMAYIGDNSRIGYQATLEQMSYSGHLNTRVTGEHPVGQQEDDY
jgi:hypothetical protein